MEARRTIHALVKRLRFSVIVPTFNYGSTLATALSSVLVQDRDDVEIIVIDDASVDNTREIVKQYEPFIRYHRNHENLGPAGAWAVGLDMAQGDWVTKLDADDWLLPEFFDHIVAAIRSDTGMVIGSVFDFHEARRLAYLRPVVESDLQLNAEDFRRKLLSQFFFRMPATALRRDLARASDPPDLALRLPHDWEFFLRATRGFGASLIADPIAVYRIHSRSLTGTSRRDERLQADMHRFLRSVRDPESAGYLTPRERSVFAVGLGQTYLRIVGADLRPTQLRPAIESLRFAVELAGSERRVLGAQVAAFGVWEATKKATGLGRRGRAVAAVDLWRPPGIDERAE